MPEPAEQEGFLTPQTVFGMTDWSRRGLRDTVFVEGHADRGVHADFFQRADFASGGNSTGCDDREFRRGAQVR